MSTTKDTTSVDAGPKAGWREWAGLTVLLLPTLLVALDINVVFLALPRISVDLGADGVQQLWITDIYGFMVAGLVITMGTLGDRIGRRRLLMMGGAAFAVASVLAAYSTSPEMLIMMRALLGIAGATLMPSTLALIVTMFADAKQRGRAIAVWATCQFAGAALGPVLGGLLLEHFWWGSVFLPAVPAMAALLLAGPVLLPEHRTSEAGRLDLASAVLSLAAILPVVYGIKRLAAGTTDPALPTAAIVAGTVLGVAFVRRQLRLADPLLDLGLLSQRSVRLVLTALVLAGVAMAGTGLLVTQYLQTVLGYSPAESALWFAPMGLAVAVGTMLTPTVTRWVTPTTAIAAGLALSAAGSGLLMLVDSTGGPAVAVVGIAVLALGTGPLFASGTGIVVGSAPPERAGSAASMSETGNYLGGTLGMAVLGTVGAVAYRHGMNGAVPTDVATDVGHSARETVAGATAAAAKLPAEEATDLVHAAHEAFISGINTVGAITGILLIGLAILLAALLRQAAQGEAP